MSRDSPSCLILSPQSQAHPHANQTISGPVRTQVLGQLLDGALRQWIALLVVGRHSLSVVGGELIASRTRPEPESGDL